MEIEIETKYNVGDELYYVEERKIVKKRKIVKILVCAYENAVINIVYKFDDGDTTSEKYMDCYFRTRTEAIEYMIDK